MNIIDRSDLTGPIVVADKRKANASVIVIHRNTVAPDVDGVAAFFAAPSEWHLRLFPYHFFLDEIDGVVAVSQVHSVDTVSPHAGPQKLNGPGVAICLNCDGRVKAPSTAMQAACVDLIARVMLATSIRSVTGHSVQKKCPGPLVPIETMARAARHKIDTEPLVAEGIRLSRVW